MPTRGSKSTLRRVFFEKTELREKSMEQKCSYFLLCIGEKGREIYKTLDLPPETEAGEDDQPVWRRTTQQLKTAFRTYCNPRKNLTFERHKFLKRDQGESETIDQYVTALRTLASTCEFGELKDSLIKDKIVIGVRSQALRECLLREADLGLQRAVDISRAGEYSKEQMKSLSGESKKIDNLGRKQNSHRKNNQPPRSKDRNQPKQAGKKQCGNCGRVHEPRSCFAYGKTCRSCGKLGHFSKLCRSSQDQTKPVHDLNYETDESAGLDEITIDTCSGVKQ